MARQIEIDALSAEHDENECRLNFSTSERVAIGRAIEARYAGRQGQRTDIQPDELVENFPQADPGQKTRVIAAKQAGFGNHETYRLPPGGHRWRNAENMVPGKASAQDWAKAQTIGGTKGKWKGATFYISKMLKLFLPGCRQLLIEGANQVPGRGGEISERHLPGNRSCNFTLSLVAKNVGWRRQNVTCCRKATLRCLERNGEVATNGNPTLLAVARSR